MLKSCIIYETVKITVVSQRLLNLYCVWQVHKTNCIYKFLNTFTWPLGANMCCILYVQCMSPLKGQVKYTDVIVYFFKGLHSKNSSLSKISVQYLVVTCTWQSRPNFAVSMSLFKIDLKMENIISDCYTEPYNFDFSSTQCRLFQFL